MIPFGAGGGAGAEAPYDGGLLDASRPIPEKALIRCHKSGCYYERELMVQLPGGDWVHKDLVDHDPVTGKSE